MSIHKQTWLPAVKKMFACDAIVDTEVSLNIQGGLCIFFLIHELIIGWYTFNEQHEMCSRAKRRTISNGE